jgi:fatty-acyl-CoA synthase
MSGDTGLTLLTDVLKFHSRYLRSKAALIDDTETISYGSLASGIDVLEGQFRDQGVCEGDRVGIAMLPNALNVASLFALWQLGAIACPINTRLNEEEIAAYASTLGLSTVIVDPSHSYLSWIAPQQIALDREPSIFGKASPQMVPDGGDRIARQLDHNAPAIAFPTGGTTGAPKAAVWTLLGLSGVANSICLHVDIQRYDCELYMSPLFHVSVLTGILAPLYVGASVYLSGAFDPNRVLDILASTRITRMFAVPTAYERLMKENATQGGIPGGESLRVLVFGASGSSPDFVKRLHGQFPAAGIYTGYGASEFGPVTRVYPSEFASGQEVGVGRPVAGVRIEVVDEAEVEQSEETRGRIVVYAPWQMIGYMGKEDHLARDGKGIITGDIGEIKDGFLHLWGRVSDMIKSGGEQVFPVEVERVVLQHVGVESAAVYGVPDNEWGERVECAIVPTETWNPDEVELREFCRKRMSGFKVPKRFIFLSSLPLTSNLKLDRRALVRAASDV